MKLVVDIMMKILEGEMREGDVLKKEKSLHK